MTAFPRSVQDWFLLIVENRDDGKVIKQMIAELNDEYQWPSRSLDIVPKQQHLLNLITAIRLDQMAKEGSA